MTTMEIANKARCAKRYERYVIDRNEYPTIQDLRMLAGECMNDDVYLIRVYENNEELFHTWNNK